ncbi:MULTISPECIES: ribosome small subunit-dependent GTPase A [Petrotoga]|uniref:Small ribosomal subunit biogenesis GTPase RsgA n=2 Tax=Petrotoga sibirica TaxID=156202 RepID=A0A4R8EWU4_9BACT|nr:MULTISPECIES: ribosome small subunit-dependent GTPase A [Petrotoga]POZ88101.1 hypothetical protein AA80_08525 [Petrotoga sibirica DSM 13575]POZ90191.1 hypothetical protein AD60_08655 [Petrotoga sp. SL27]TDX17204.1 ribosome biogenesis GTPase [Petrotoga sibirica]
MVEEIMKKYGYFNFFRDSPINDNIGRITFVSKENYLVMTPKGELIGKLKGRYSYEIEDAKEFPYVGDWVSIQYTGNEKEVLIDHLFRRKNRISRKMRGKQFSEQIIACNVDYIIFCMSTDENFSLRLLEKYLYAFSWPNSKSLLVLTKKDLAENVEKNIKKIKELYPNLEVIATSIYEDSSIKLLLPYLLEGTTSVIIGSSGVGKSTLINHIAGKEIFKTREISKKTQRGKHTTTFRKLIYLGEGLGCIIDTPGLSSVSLWSSYNSNSAFSDIEELSLHCKFRNCTHTVEKGCAVLKGVKDGIISEDRYKNFIKLKREENFMKSKIDFNINKKRNKEIEEREKMKKSKRRK